MSILLKLNSDDDIDVMTTSNHLTSDCIEILEPVGDNNRRTLESRRIEIRQSARANQIRELLRRAYIANRDSMLSALLRLLEEQVVLGEQKWILPEEEAAEEEEEVVKETGLEVGGELLIADGVGLAFT